MPFSPTPAARQIDGVPGTAGGGQPLDPPSVTIGWADIVALLEKTKRELTEVQLFLGDIIVAVFSVKRGSDGNLR